MSVQLIQQYHTQVEKIIRYGGSRNEGSVRKAFHDLLEAYARQKNLEIIAELEYRTRTGRPIYPDGTLKDALRQDWGYWESKDEKDDLDSEIATKFAKGYPANNILFEDTQTAVLIQAGEEVARVPFLDAPALDAVLSKFVSYESREVREFREAIENFTRDIPALGEMLRDAIREQFEQNGKFQKAAKDFLELCQEAINPSMEMADVREMIVQHVLTEDIFVTVFDEPQFHRENIIAHELGEVVNTFYTGQVRRQIDGRIAGYTRAIKARAAQIYNHQEKQKFLKVLYENFYKAYNPKAADRLGIVYTPNEIVRFMIEAADHLCFKHFGKTLGDPGVEILDPATGTGTFITEIIEYLPPHQLEHKYKQELHCNEVAILPYYIANLNIEYTYKQKMGAYQPFENIVFVDTLDNMGFKTGYVRQLELFGLTDENSERIERQNKREISVIIGNPPYNAHQLSENHNNKNRDYPEIDKRIRNTYVKNSTAQKTQLYDMFVRFYRWATDRVSSNGIVAFVTNRSFLDKRNFDGFREVVGREFQSIFIIDLGGDVRINPKLSGPKHNVFAIQTGVAICLLVKDSNRGSAKISYLRRPEMETAVEKLKYLSTAKLKDLPFTSIIPDANSNWLHQVENNWDSLLPIGFRGTSAKEDQTIFNISANGVVTARDEWVYSFEKSDFKNKIQLICNVFDKQQKKISEQGIDKKEIDSALDYSIKWSSTLKSNLFTGQNLKFEEKLIVVSLHRPYVKQFYYSEKTFSDRLTANHYEMFGSDLQRENFSIQVNFESRMFACLITDSISDYALLKFGNGGTAGFPLYRYDNLGNRVDNITDWALHQFRSHYFPGNSEVSGEMPDDTQTITKTDIFHYVYAVLHHPAYRAKYQLNLKREFPRIPFYDDFWQWAAWGQQLMQLHLNYETIAPYPLHREDKDPETTRTAYKAKLRRVKARLDPTDGSIEIDTLTSLSGIPAEAWDYKLGNRSALEWVLDRYKERKPRDPTIREQFNTYRFRDYKEQVIDLLARVCTVSVETMRIIHQMPNEHGEEA